MTGWVSLTSSNMQAWQTGQLTNFVARRLEHDRMTMQRFASCRDVVQAARVQQDWFADAFASYLEESRRGCDRDRARHRRRNEPRAGRLAQLA